MLRLLQSPIGRLRIIGILEGLSLLFLIFVAVPMKYYWHNPAASMLVGPIHGALFLLFFFNTLHVGVEYQWKFRQTTWKVLLACIIPFGTFYIDQTILRKMTSKEQQ